MNQNNCLMKEANTIVNIIIIVIYHNRYSKQSTISLYNYIQYFPIHSKSKSSNIIIDNEDDN